MAAPREYPRGWELWGLAGDDGNCETEAEFLAALDDEKGMSKKFIQIWEMIQMRPQGPGALPREICHDIERGLYQLSVGFKLRLLFSYDPNHERRMVMLHWYRKGAGKGKGSSGKTIPDNERNRALRVKEWYQNLN
ncbi:type II toxin-antitoxin system RelE/ParE family toxin [Solimonas sp. K1W22B-7]|uniref:type II toxin-antitoxin system RelE/ParE family toxin n=1 Tax=Solimonas sp. K1W22B-7 TaxID=2303331 RepID=UPI0013C4DED1|nr:type II toxin-antitoxin system RelE/ParE family toxin [Solimonas sp. K1W22B-7]